MRRMNARGGGDKAGVTATVRRSNDIGTASPIGDTCTVAGLLVPGKVDAAKAAGNCVFTMQQSVRRECEPSGRKQQLCAPLGLCCRHIPNGAIVIPIKRMAIAARWKEPRNMHSA